MAKAQHRLDGNCTRDLHLIRVAHYLLCYEPIF